MKNSFEEKLEFAKKFENTIKKKLTEDFNYKVSKTRGKRDWDLYIKGEKFEVKSFDIEKVKWFNEFCIELTNINTLGWIFNIKAKYIIVTLINKNEIEYAYVFDAEKLQKQVISILKKNYGEDYLNKMKNANDDLCYENKSTKVIWQKQKENGKKKYLLFIKNVYDKDWNIQQWGLKKCLIKKEDFIEKVREKIA